MEEKLEIDLIDKKIYSYIMIGNKIKFRIWKITKVYEKNGITMIVAGSCYHMPLSSVGSTTSFANEWFTFERNDKQARQILYGAAKCNFYSCMKNLMDQMERRKKDFDEIFEIIENFDVEKDEWHWERYGDSEELHDD